MYPFQRPPSDEDFEQSLQIRSAHSLAERFDYLRNHDRVGLRIVMDEYPEYVRSMVDQYIAHTEYPGGDEQLRDHVESDLASLRNAVDTNSAVYKMRLRGRSLLRAIGLTRHPSRPPLDAPMYLPRTEDRKLSP